MLNYVCACDSIFPIHNILEEHPASASQRSTGPSDPQPPEVPERPDKVKDLSSLRFVASSSVFSLQTAVLFASSSPSCCSASFACSLVQFCSVFLFVQPPECFFLFASFLVQLFSLWNISCEYSSSVMFRVTPDCLFSSIYSFSPCACRNCAYHPLLPGGRIRPKS